MGYHHYTTLVFLKSSFYPFGMEIVPLSSYAAIKLPNDRDYQGNECISTSPVSVSLFYVPFLIHGKS